MNHTQTILILIASAIIFLLLILYIIIKFKKLNISIEQLKYSIFVLRKDNEKYSNLTLEMFDLLQTSVHTTLDRLEEKKNKHIYPTPELSEQITKTISEQIEIQVILNNKTRVPSSKLITEVVNVVRQTYPNIKEDYIINKTITMIETLETRT
jgi:hypothetical protein